MENEINDDGSLACLNIPRNADSRSFNCGVITQSKLCNHIIPQEYASII